MIIRKCTISKTATRSPLDNRGYDRREHPRRDSGSNIDPDRVAHLWLMGHTFSVLPYVMFLYRRSFRPTVTERRRFHRLGGTIDLY